MKEIKVNASKKYNITVTDSLADFNSALLPLLTDEKVALITDSNVEKLYADKILELLKDKTVIKLVIEAGERSKNAENYINLINGLAQAGLSRKSAVITLGGGVVGDLGAFVASTYMRGIKLIAIPTTLLSMVDSSVGGKTGIDLEAGKNLCGTFYQPDAVYINTEFLKTLPEREIICGMGEIMKYAFIDSRITPEDIEQKNLENLIVKSVEIKRDIVERDEKESGERMLLNFGHTVGHAIEKLKNYTLSHGECVIMGMYHSLKASFNLGFMDKKTYAKAIAFLEKSGVKEQTELKKQDLISALKKDKKADGKSVNFVLASDFGKPIIKNLEISRLEDIL